MKDNILLNYGTDQLRCAAVGTRILSSNHTNRITVCHKSVQWGERDMHDHFSTKAWFFVVAWVRSHSMEPWKSDVSMESWGDYTREGTN